MRLAVPAPTITPDAIEAEVVHLDRFGNLITNLERRELEDWLGDRSLAQAHITVAERQIDGIAETYGNAPPGALLALFESTGCLEIAAREASAARLLNAARGTEVTLRR